MEVYSLFELNQYIKQVVALNFVDSLWISCEISQISESRGHCYLELIEKDEEDNKVKAMISAVMWYREYSFIRKKLGAIADKVLQDGMQVKLKIEVDFHERFGIKLIIKDIDPSYTYGQLAIQREQIIERLRTENRMELNKSIYFPSVVQKCAIISSDTAAGYQDLIQHLDNNDYRYAFDYQLFPAAMQGNRTEMEVVSQLREINSLDKFQLVIITRGGGSKLDLSAFDSYSISKQISEMSIPVITGIGHDIDLSIADMVSALSLKTPTAVANFLIDHNASFESALYDTAIQIKLATQDRLKKIEESLNQAQQLNNQIVKNRIQSKVEKLNQFDQINKQIAKNKIQIKKESLKRYIDDIPSLAKSKLKNIAQRLNNWEEINVLINPEKLLEKGYSITMKDGKYIEQSSLLKAGDEITTKFKDGEIISTVNK